MSKRYLIEAYTSLGTLASEFTNDLTDAEALFEMFRRDWPKATIELWDGTELKRHWIV